ncbi:MAG TPA: ATP-binding protein [Opitutaceae bacterium]
MDRRAEKSRLVRSIVGLFLRPSAKRPVRDYALLFSLVALVSVANHFTGQVISLTTCFLVPVTLATGWYGWRSGLVMIGSTILARLADDWWLYAPKPVPLRSWWVVLMSTIIFSFIVALLDALLVLHRELEAKVDERTNQLRESVVLRQRLEREILDAGARERSAIGRELHDELGQHLTATALAAQTLVLQLGERPEAKKAKAIVRWIEEGTDKARKLARGLLLEEIEPQRLPKELRELALSAGRGGIRSNFQHDGPTVGVDGPDCAHLFRIAQEAVGNALRHANPQGIDISLRSGEHELCLIVQDDGRGFAGPQGSGEGRGLQIMEHRARLIGATVTWVTAPGEGTKVICKLPQAP